MIWIVEAVLNIVTNAAGDEVVDRAMRRRRKRRGEPEPEDRRAEEGKKELLWFAGFGLMCGAALAALDSWPLWFNCSLAAIGLATFIFGLVVRRRMVQRDEG
jgi:hypothetical protein